MLQAFMDAMERFHTALHRQADAETLRKCREEMDRTFKAAVDDLTEQHSLACKAACALADPGKRLREMPTSMFPGRRLG